eukprot:GHUV01002601.1.p1 GENE.GHUV01002601.1~~GHUV01002601.1.p1  ORF type:complete len:473 (+),score=117.90 GHUV01002601.1:154-1572(+)
MQSATCMQATELQRPCIRTRCVRRAATCAVRAVSSRTRQSRVSNPPPQLEPAKKIVAPRQPANEIEATSPAQSQQQGLRWLSPSSLVGGSQATLLGLAAVSSAGVLGSGFEVQGPGSVLQALGVLAAIIAVHEWGHFTAARLQNIHVTQFAIGFGPPIVSFKRGEVEYSLRAIPLGGYVAFPDDDPKTSKFPQDDPDLLQNRSIPERALVISAGVIANVIFALAVLFAQMNIVGKAQTSYLPGVLVPQINSGGVAERAGFQQGDVILRVGDHEVKANPLQVPDLVSTIKAHPNEKLVFQVQRGEQILDLKAKPAVGKDGSGAIGVSLLSHTYIKHTMPSNVADAFTMAGSEFNRLAGSVLSGLKNIVTNFSGMAGQLSGPVAIVAAGSEIARTDAAGLYQFCAIVNINLAVVNILPLPALDGGYLLLLLLEAARGKKLPETLEQGVMTSGLLLMMVLGVGLAIRDTINLAVR